MKEQEEKWGGVFNRYKIMAEHRLDVNLACVGIDPYLDSGTVLCLTCDEYGRAEITVDEVSNTAIEFRTLPIHIGKTHGMWFNVEQMKALRDVLDAVIENAEDV